MRHLKFAATFLGSGFWWVINTSGCLANPGLPPNAPVREELTLDGYTMLSPSGMALYYDNAMQIRSFATIGPCSDKPSILTDDKVSGLGPRPILGAKYVKGCTQKWPPFFAADGAQPVGDFTLVDRSGGKQWAWMGHPLFLSVKDKKPGDRNGSFIPGIYVGAPGSNAMALAKLPEELPMGLRLVLRDEGLVIAAANGKAVYTPKKKGQSDQRLDPILAPAMAATLKDRWSVVTTGPDRKQLAFNGKPLYALNGPDSEMDIEDSGGWETVVFSPSPKRPPEIGRHLTLDGEVYTDKEGRTLYTYTCNTASIGGPAVGVPCDDAGDPAAYVVALCGSPQECAQRWKPYLAREDAKPAWPWSVVEVAYPMFTDPRGTLYPPDAPRVKAWAYRGNPVYTYYDDKKPGDGMGDRMYGLWAAGMFDMLHVPGHEISE